MTCINPNNCIELYSNIRDNQNNGKNIISEHSMKILGFHFSSKPNVEKHVEEISRKFRKRLWLLRNMKNVIKEKKELVDIYTCFLRPILDYCSNVYHSMLTIYMY